MKDGVIATVACDVWKGGCIAYGEYGRRSTYVGDTRSVSGSCLNCDRPCVAKINRSIGKWQNNLITPQLGNCYWTMSYVLIMLDTFQSLDISLESSVQMHRASSHLR